MSTLEYKRFHKISDEVLNMLKTHLEHIEFSKGEDFFSTHRKHHYINFLEEGLLRAYSNHKEKEITFWFDLEGELSSHTEHIYMTKSAMKLLNALKIVLFTGYHVSL